MSRAHPSAEQLERYRHRSASAEDLLFVDEHIAACDECFAAVGAADEAVVLAAAESSERAHLTYEEMERWVDGRADSIDRELVDGHAAHCDLCRSELADLMRVKDATHAPRIGVNRWWLAAAAMLIVGLTALVILRTEPVPPTPGQTNPPLSVETRPPDPLPPDLRSHVEQIVASGVLKKPDVVASLAGDSSPLLGAEREAAAFAVLDPLMTVVLDARPRFQWESLSGASSYSVTIADAESGVVVGRGSTPTVSWQPAKDLERGRTYSWQVTAHRSDGDVTAPQPPAPEARFQIASRARVEEVDRWKNDGVAPLALGILLAERGLLDDAERELERAGDPRADPFLTQVRSWRSLASRPALPR